MKLNSDRKEDLLTAIIISVCCYLLLLYLALFLPQSKAMWDQALGPSPYGVEQRLFVALWITAICLPLPYGFYYTVVTIRFTKREVKKRSLSDHVADHLFPLRALFKYMRYLLSNAGIPSAIKKSKLITLGLLLYLIVIATTWIFWAESKGI